MRGTVAKKKSFHSAFHSFHYRHQLDIEIVSRVVSFQLPITCREDDFLSKDSLPRFFFWSQSVFRWILERTHQTLSLMYNIRKIPGTFLWSGHSYC